MDLFPRAFLVVFAQISVGGMLALSIPPFHELERGYFKSTAFVFLLLGSFGLIGRVALWWNAAAGTSFGLDLALFTVFFLAGCGYFASLWGEQMVLRARLFTACWMSGIASLIALAVSYAPPGGVLEAVLFPIGVVVGALLLGVVTAGMLLGHWYLIDRGLSIEPFRIMHAFYTGLLAVQIVTLPLCALLLYFAGTETTANALAALAVSSPLLIATRVIISPIGSLVLAGMIHRTLQIPQTMAATGLFYIAILTVMVGEFLGRYLLFRSGVPF